jgi:membrane fusion protein (multidrug efflux system)
MHAQTLERPSPKIQLQRPAKKKRGVLKFVVTAVLFFVAALVVIGGIKGLQIFTMVKNGQPPVPSTTVTSAPVREEHWAPELSAVGSVAPVQGAMLAMELPGTVEEVKFENGSTV